MTKTYRANGFRYVEVEIYVAITLLMNSSKLRKLKSMPQVLNKRNLVPGSMPGVYIGRPYIYGNPFPMRKESERDEVVAKFREYFYKRIAIDPAFRFALEDLRDKDLICWCAPKPCHGDVILEWLQANPPT